MNKLGSVSKFSSGLVCQSPKRFHHSDLMDCAYLVAMQCSMLWMGLNGFPASKLRPKQVPWRYSVVVALTLQAKSETCCLLAELLTSGRRQEFLRLLASSCSSKLGSPQRPNTFSNILLRYREEKIFIVYLPTQEVSVRKKGFFSAPFAVTPEFHMYGCWSLCSPVPWQSPFLRCWQFWE